MKPLVILPEAEEDVIESAAFYESKEKGLELDFLSEVDETIKKIQVHPDRWPIIQKNYRKCLLRRFPFYIAYSIEPTEIIIIAIAHQRRMPYFWQKRVKGLR